MQYWEDMNSKYGFNEGLLQPPGVNEYRSVYIRAVNKLLEKHNSKCRVVAYEGGCSKNGCLWLRVTKEEFSNLWDHQVLDGSHHLTEEEHGDDAWDKAVEEANELHLDDCVSVKIEVAVDEDHFNSLLQNSV